MTPQTPLVVEVTRGDVDVPLRRPARPRRRGRSTRRRARSLTIKAIDRTLELDLRGEDRRLARHRRRARSPRRSSPPTGSRRRSSRRRRAPTRTCTWCSSAATDLAFLRALATKWGYAVYLESENGRVVGHFHPLDPLADPQGELSLGFGGDALRVQARRRAHRRPAGARGADPRRCRTPPQVGDSTRATTSPRAQRSLGGQATVLLAPDDVTGELEPLAAATGLARRSAFARQPDRRDRHRRRRPDAAREAHRARARARLLAVRPLPRRARAPRDRRRPPPPAAARSCATRSASRATSRSAGGGLLP